MPGQAQEHERRHSGAQRAGRERHGIERRNPKARAREEHHVHQAGTSLHESADPPHRAAGTCGLEADCAPAHVVEDDLSTHLADRRESDQDQPSSGGDIATAPRSRNSALSTGTKLLTKAPEKVERQVMAVDMARIRCPCGPRWPSSGRAFPPRPLEDAPWPEGPGCV